MPNEHTYLDEMESLKDLKYERHICVKTIGLYREKIRNYKEGIEHYTDKLMIVNDKIIKHNTKDKS